MRKYLLFAFAAVVLFSCNKENETTEKETPSKSLEYVFSVADKPSFDANTRAVKSSWQDGDRIFIVFDGAEPSQWEDFMILTHDGRSDEGWVVSQESATNKPKDTGGTLSALYCEIPDEELGKYSGDLVLASYGYGQYMVGNDIPYTVKDGTLSASLSLDFEKSDDRTYVQLRITDLPASETGWKLEPDDYLHGEENTFDVFLPTWSHDRFSYLVLNDIAGDAMEFPMDGRDDGFYLYFFVQQKADKITFTITNRDNNNKYRKTFSRKISGKCSAITFKGPQLDADGTPTNDWKRVNLFGLTFADSAVERICLDNWDTDGDGYLSYTEAAAVTDIGDVFRENEEITSFDELQYFTGIQEIPASAFSGCTSLQSVVLPENVVSINNDAFSYTVLTSILIPASVSSIAPNPFNHCPALETIIVDEGNEVFDSRNNCNAIISKKDYSYELNDQSYPIGADWMIVGCKNTVIPESVVTIFAAFQFCEGLTSIVIPDSVTKLTSAAFFGCSGLETVDFGHGIKTLDPVSFTRCSSLKEVVLPESLESMALAFNECSSLESVTIYALVPPSGFAPLPQDIQYDIYVPAESLEAYKTASNWEPYAENIKAIPTGVDG